MMLCTPYSLNIDNYADIKRKGVVNAAIMHKALTCLFFYSVTCTKKYI